MPDSQKLSAKELANILRTAKETVSIEGKTIEGDLDLSSIDIPVAVSLRNCIFKERVNFSMAQVAGSLNLSESTFEKGLSLEGTRIGHHLILDGCVFKSQASPALDTCRIEVKGDLHLNDTQFYAPWQGEGMQIQGSILAEGLIMEGNPPPAARLNGARVGGSIFIARGNLGHVEFQNSRSGLGIYVLNSQFVGEAKFIGIQIGSQAVFRGVSLKDKIFFDEAEVKGGLFFLPDTEGNTCSIKGEAKFIGAKIGGQAAFEGVSFKDVLAFDGAEVKGGLFFKPDDKGNPCSIEGEARFLGTKIGGQANFKGVSFKNGVTFDRAEVKCDLFFQPDDEGNPCSIEGEARFPDAHIDGQANFVAVRFKDNVIFIDVQIDGQAKFEGVGFKGEVAFDRAEVKGGLLFSPDDKGNSCSIEGEAKFLGAKIGAQAVFQGMSFKNKVFFDGAEVNDLFFQPDDRGNPCIIAGEARFPGAKIGGQVNFLEVSFGKEVFFNGAHVDGETYFLKRKIPTFIAIGAHFSKVLKIGYGTKIGDFVIKDAKVGTLNIDWGGISGKLELMGCEYGSVEDKEGLLEVLLSKGVRERQPYEFLENYSRGIGETDFANEVYYNRCLLVAPMPAGNNIPLFVWDRLLRWGAGYGVRPWYMVYWLLGFWMIGFIMFEIPWFIRPFDPPGKVPSFPEAAWLSLINLLPGIPGEYPVVVNRWELTPLGQWFATILRIAGWVVVSAGGLAATGLFRRYER